MKNRPITLLLGAMFTVALLALMVQIISSVRIDSHGSISLRSSPTVAHAQVAGSALPALVEVDVEKMSCFACHSYAHYREGAPRAEREAFLAGTATRTVADPVMARLARDHVQAHRDATPANFDDIDADDDDDEDEDSDDDDGDDDDEDDDDEDGDDEDGDKSGDDDSAEATDNKGDDDSDDEDEGEEKVFSHDDHAEELDGFHCHKCHAFEDRFRVVRRKEACEECH